MRKKLYAVALFIGLCLSIISFAAGTSNHSDQKDNRPIENTAYTEVTISNEVYNQFETPFD